MKDTKSEHSSILYAVGLGPGDPRLLTQYAIKVFEEADTIFYIETPNGKESISLSILNSIGGVVSKCRCLHFSMAKEMKDREKAWDEAASKVIECLEKNKKVAVATLGDPLIYSTFGYLRRKVIEKVGTVEIKIVPGITSFQAAAAIQGEPLVENNEVLTVIPAWKKDLTHHNAINSADTAVFLKTYRTRKDVLGSIKSKMKSKSVLYVSRLGLPEEIIEDSIDKIQDLPVEYLSLIIAKQRTNR